MMMKEKRITNILAYQRLRIPKAEQIKQPKHKEKKSGKPELRLGSFNFPRTIEFPATFLTVSNRFSFRRCIFFVLSPAYFAQRRHFTAFAFLNRAGQVTDSGKPNTRNSNILCFLINLRDCLLAICFPAPTHFSSSESNVT